VASSTASPQQNAPAATQSDPSGPPLRSLSPALCALGAVVTAVLLDFCFPIAGPLPRWRAALTFVALVPLLWALLNKRAAAHPRYLRRSALTAYLSGVLWYALNCYWIYQTMLYYGHVPPFGSVGILILFSAILGLYFGLFGLLLAFFRRRFGLTVAFLLAPFLWTAIELLAARFTSVPWDQLGYSMVDSAMLTDLAPITGVYGISFLVFVLNIVFLWSFVYFKERDDLRLQTWRFLVWLGMISVLVHSAQTASAPTSAYAVLLQPNINVEAGQPWSGSQWTGQPSWILAAAAQSCTSAYAGMPPARNPPDAPPPAQACPLNIPPPGVVLWPEVASWFQSDDPRTQAVLAQVARSAHAPFIAGMAGVDPSGFYNSAVFTNPDGSIHGRYDKIHLVPFGEYVPFRNLFFFAHKLTNQLGDTQRGTERKVFTAPGPDGQPHTFGIFICYESVFADEVRHFALNGAQVLVNVSDDGWYGDTSAPWQHLNMARMRAIENRRWILRDTNNGVTTVIDPYGRVTLSAPRHTLTSLVARYGYRSDLTFYTRYGDVFAYFCCAVVLVALIASIKRPALRG
jgi:apolipoprotein N-acyltransferase